MRFRYKKVPSEKALKHQIQVIRRAGYLNEISPTMEELSSFKYSEEKMKEGKKRVTEACCYSKQCFNKNERNSKKQNVENKWAIWCPDCGHALIWKTTRI